MMSMAKIEQCYLILPYQLEDAMPSEFEIR